MKQELEVYFQIIFFELGQQKLCHLMTTIAQRNNQIVEVKHGMSVTINTWEELCEQAGISMGDIPGDTPVQRFDYRWYPHPL